MSVIIVWLPSAPNVQSNRLQTITSDDVCRAKKIHFIIMKDVKIVRNKLLSLYFLDEADSTFT